MSSRCIVAIALIALVLTLAQISPSQDTEFVQPTSPASQDQIISSYYSHDPIIILGNSDFAEQAATEGWNGTGLEVSPYIIKGYYIESDSKCIQITNTSVYYVVQDCYLTNITAEYAKGIHLDNSINGRVENCSADSLYMGYEILNSPGYVLKNNSATACSWAIRVFNSSNTIVESSSLKNCRTGVALTQTYNCTAESNNLSNTGFYIFASSAEFWHHNFTANTINGRPLGYFTDLKGGRLNISSYGQVLLGNLTDVEVFGGMFNSSTLGVEVGYSTNVTVSDIEVHHQEQGVTLARCNNSLVKNVIADENNEGLVFSETENCTMDDCDVRDSRSHGSRIDGTRNSTVHDSRFSMNRMAIYVLSGNCTIENNSLFGNDMGIYLHAAHSCVVINNTVQSDEESGIYIWRASDCNITRNIVTDNAHNGIALSDTTFTSVFNNTLYRNGDYGIWIIDQSFNNTVFNNWIGWNDVENARDDGKDNTWDNGVDFGNFWNDYVYPGQYVIFGSADSRDRYPGPIVDLDGPVIAITRSPIEVNSTTSAVISAAVQDYNDVESVLLSFSIDGGTSWTTINMTIDDNLVWTAIIPAFPDSTTVHYRVFANDSKGNSRWSMISVYTVDDQIIGTTSTTSTSTTSFSTAPTEPELPPEPIDLSVYLLIILTLTLGLVAISILFRRK
jgi:parallel beta-helix repeat protein